MRLQQPMIFKLLHMTDMEFLGHVSAHQHVVEPSFLLRSKKLVTEEEPLEVKDTN